MNYDSEIKKMILDKDYEVDTSIILKSIETKDKLPVNYLFETERGHKRLNEFLLEVFINKKEGLPNFFYETFNEKIKFMNDSNCFYHDGSKIHTTNLTSILTIETIKRKDVEHAVSLIDNGVFSEHSLMNISSNAADTLSLADKRIHNNLVKKINEIGENPERFILYSYLAEKYKPKRSPNIENILKSINDHIRLSDFEELKVKVKKFGYGYNTQELCDKLIERIEPNKCEDFKNELSIDLDTKETKTKKLKI